MSRVLTITPSGHLQIPAELQNLFSVGKFWVKSVANKIVLEPVLPDSEKNFGVLSLSSFDFWEGAADDIYADHCQKKICVKRVRSF